jgi:hypothetical protein
MWRAGDGGQRELFVGAFFVGEVHLAGVGELMDGVLDAGGALEEDATRDLVVGTEALEFEDGFIFLPKGFEDADHPGDGLDLVAQDLGFYPMVEDLLFGIWRGLGKSAVLPVASWAFLEFSTW